jgi:hypothetical protein
MRTPRAYSYLDNSGILDFVRQADVNTLAGVRVWQRSYSLLAGQVEALLFRRIYWDAPTRLQDNNHPIRDST